MSIGVGALFVGLIAMSFLVLSKQIDYAALGTPSNVDSATTSNSSGFGSVGNMNKSVDDSITRALLRKSNDHLAASNPMVDYGTIDENAKREEIKS